MSCRCGWSVSPRYEEWWELESKWRWLIFRGWLPLVVRGRRYRSLLCNRAPPPPLRARGSKRRRGLPRGRGAGFSGCVLWNSSVSVGSRISPALTKDRSSGPNPSQSTRYWRVLHRRLESSNSCTRYASSPSTRKGRGVCGLAPISVSPLGPPAGFRRDTWNVGEMR